MKKEKRITKKDLKKLEKRKIKKQFLEWSKNVKERDNYQCVICKCTKYLHTHHIIPREIHPLRFDIDNGITLCAKHHKYSYEISPHKNPFVFIKWFEKNFATQYLALRIKTKEIINSNI